MTPPGTGHQDNIATGLAEVPMQPWERRKCMASEASRMQQSTPLCVVSLAVSHRNAMMWH